MRGERQVTVTPDDVAFVEQAVEHYRAFADGAKDAGEAKVEGICRKQEFYAERFLIRLRGKP